MRVVLLAGGLGTRLAEETEVRPKPMVEIGGRPILWHIMKHYAHFGCDEFFIALGYKGDVIKRFFVDYYSLTSSMTVALSSGHVEVRDDLEAPGEREDWVVHLCDTGEESNTGGRLKRMEAALRPGGTFMLTYGDGVANVDITALLEFHRAHGGDGGELISEFTEKPQVGEGWINGGFLVLEPEVFDYLKGDADSLERDALEPLARDRQLVAYRHEGFWQCMDTLRDKRMLEHMWHDRTAPWKTWT